METWILNKEAENGKPPYFEHNTDQFRLFNYVLIICFGSPQMHSQDAQQNFYLFQSCHSTFAGTVYWEQLVPAVNVAVNRLRSMSFCFIKKV